MEKVAIIHNENARYSRQEDIHQMVTDLFCKLDLDKEHFNTEKWNPLGKYVKSNNCVLIKPNLVLHKNYCQRYKENIECVVTNISIIKEIVDYVVVALNGTGRIIIGDAPVQECDFEKLVNISGYQKLVDEYKKRGINIELIDFRGVKSKSHYGVLHQNITNAPGTLVKLNKESSFVEFSDCDLEKIRITNYNSLDVTKHHNASVNEYYISTYFLEADVVINVPKPKTHKKAGITACLKNMVGINCRKEYLPHHRAGSIEEGGDEYQYRSIIKRMISYNHDKFCYCVYSKKYLLARFYQVANILEEFLIKKVYKDKTSFGSWSGNNTISRTIFDLNLIALYADSTGEIKDKQQRKIFNVLDMVVSGEHNGPMGPEPKMVGILMGGENSYACDYVVSRLMGAIPSKIPTLCGNENKKYPIYKTKGEDISIVSNDCRWNKKSVTDKEFVNFSYLPPDGWNDAFLNNI